MPWKLIIFLLCLILTTVFIGFNLDYTCSINVLFTTFTEAPVSIVVLSSVTFGAILSALFILGMKVSKKSKNVVKQDAPVVAPTVKNTSPTMNYSYGENTTIPKKQSKSSKTKIEEAEKIEDVEVKDV